MRIAIIGAGNVGAALGKGWAQSGHEIKFGVRDVNDAKVKTLLSEIGGKASAGSVSDAAAFGEVLVLATPWNAAKDALQNAGDLTGKILFDCTNPLKAGLAGLEIGLTSSGGEQVAEWAKGAKVVKIFNTTGADNMLNPIYDGERSLMLYCGDDSEAKATAAMLASEIGFDAVDLGGLEQSRLTEPFALVWIRLAMFQGLGRNFAFKIVKR